ncbi:NAD(P)/FAD-dependent oxidoreductase, partial [Phenylobacterium sp.]|uniref:NAD(P)/FAD-dependent oxidoreductase n=1 Tax=Phenylobacterium sp. TaxID=1871053 RepID=UPI002FDD804B
MEGFDVVVIGAGAAGMMCAAEAALRGRRVLVLDHARAPGEKIRISGGGRCNFTNLGVHPSRFLSANPRFCISALSRYTPADFIALLDSAGIAWRERTLGQLFLEGSARQVVDLLVRRMTGAGAELRLSTPVRDLVRLETGFRLTLDAGEVAADRVVLATGGKSIPKMGATGYALDVARGFGLALVEPRAGLVPFTLAPDLLERLSPLAGVSAPARVRAGGAAFDESLLFTHRGLSGPAVLQASSYWREGEAVEVDLAPGVDLLAHLKTERGRAGRQSPAALLSERLPARLARTLAEGAAAPPRLGDCNDAVLSR